MSSPRRFIVGIGVANYHDATLNLKRVRDDVEQVTGWFAERTRFKHERALSELAVDPTLGALQQGLSRWMKSLKPDDVVVIYLAAHGQVENDVAYVLCSDSPSSGLAGEAITGETLGGIIGQSPPNNVLVIMDACVAGRLGSSIQRAAEDTATKANTRADPDWAQAVVCSTYGRDPAHDGKFVDAFLRVVSQERWTGTSDEWIYIDRLMDGLKSEFTVPQVAERKVWGPTSARLIPNPNFATRRLGALIADVEVESHFDPASRGVLVGERGSYFMGRAEELTQIVKWLKRPSDTSEQDLLIITGSPGSGKSALLSRVIALSDPALRARVDELAQLPPATVPPEGSIDAVLWCRNKIFDQVVQDLARRLDVNARTVDALLPAITQRTPNITIAIDALDEATEGEASRLARDLIRPLAGARGVKILVATRPHAVRGTARGSATNLLEELRSASATTIVLDDFDNRADMHRYVVARLTAASEPERKTPYRDRPDLADAVATRIVDAAGKSFLVAAVTARSLANRKEPVDVRAQDLQFPTEAGEALAAYIDRLAEPQVVIDILRPLAWAEGAGLPWGPMWVPLANALASAYRPDGPIPEYTDASVASVLSRAGDLIVETTAREPVYRLFHEKLGEHLRRGISAAAANAAIARTMQAPIAQTPLENAPPYVLAHIGTYLSRSPDGFETLYRLATNPEYERAHRLTFGHSTGFLKDVDLAIAAALAKTPVDRRSLTALCFVYSRSIAVAPAPIVDILARAGQMQRAERMANNITFAVERAWAFALLAPGFAKEDDIEEAHRCLAEAERALAAINLTHVPPDQPHPQPSEDGRWPGGAGKRRAATRQDGGEIEATVEPIGPRRGSDARTGEGKAW